MSNNVLYIAIAAVFVIILISTIIMIRNIFNKKSNTPPKNTKKRMEELREGSPLNPKDYDSMYELAEIEAEYKEFESALPKYELLLKRYFKDNDINEIDIYKKLEEGYSQIEQNEKQF